MTTLHFAHLTDIHISEQGDHHDMLSGQAAGFLQAVVADLNQIDDLDFVLLSGDLFDTASRWEVNRFDEAIEALKKPLYVIPGNHDRRPPDADTGLTRRDFAEQFNPQLAQRPTAPEAQCGYWSLEVAPQVQLIGLDSIKDDDWSGVIDEPQLTWLQAELEKSSDKLVLLSVHHPLHKMAPIDDDPYYWRFVLENSAEVLALLNRHPQVKVVFTGHHHMTQAQHMSGRLHLAGPALSIYPCAYRTLRLTELAAGRWRINWQTHPATAAKTIALASDRMTEGWQKAGYAPDFVAEHVALAYGSAHDRSGVLEL